MTNDTQRHLLLTVLGLNPRRARYELNGLEAEADLAPVALLELLPEKERPGRVMALCTPQARTRTGQALTKALRGRYPTELVDIPTGDYQADINVFLKAVTEAVTVDHVKDVDLTVDITHGYRHFSFLTYISMLYLSELRGVRVRHVYYGMYRHDSASPAPFFDLRPLLDLPRWVYALRVLNVTGSALPLTQLLRDNQKRDVSKQIASEFEHLSEAYLMGLPLELGRHAGIIE